MKKKLLSLLLVCSLLLSSVPMVSAADEASENDWTYTVDPSKGTATVTGYTGSETEIVIPDTLGSYPVTSIRSLTETNSTAEFTSITVPDSVTEFEYCAFQEMPELESVIFSEQSQLTQFGNGAFQNCVSLRNVTIPEGVTALPANSFNGCSSLLSIVIPAGVRDVGDSAFQDAASLTTVTFEENSQLERIGLRAFKGCTDLEYIAIPDSVTSYGVQAFEQCIHLKEVHLSANAQALSSQMFLYCTALTAIDLPEGLTEIANQAFNGCASLSSVRFPSTLETIGEYAFLETALTTVQIPENTQSIGNAAFNNIGTLTDVYLPSSPTTPVMSTASNAYTFYNNQNEAALTIHVFAGSAGETWAKAQQGYLGFNIAYIDSSTITVSVTDEKGVPLTSGFDVLWYIDEEYALTGSTVTVAGGDHTYSFMVALGDELLGSYYAPQMQTIDSVSGTQAVSVKLEPIPTLTVSGQICDAEGAPVSDAEIKFSQPNEILTATVDKNGYFQAQMKDVATTYTVSAEGYLNRSDVAILNRYGAETLNLGTIKLDALPDSRITLTLMREAAAKEGEDPETTQLFDFSGYHFTAINNTTNKSVTPIVQEPYLVFTEGVRAGDTLTISVEGNSSTVELDAGGQGEATLCVQENGGILIEGLAGEIQTTVLLYNETGALAETGTLSETWQSSALPDGSYTVILLQKNSLIRSASSPSALAQLGLIENTDYTRLEATVRRGVLTCFTDVTVPELDESRFSYIDADQTSVAFNGTLEPVGTLVMCTIHYTWKESAYAPSSIRLSLPEGLSIQGSPTLDGVAATFSASGDVVTIAVSNSSGVIRFYVAANQAGIYSLTPYISVADGVQPLGTASFEATEASISAPSKTSRETIAVSGVALPNSAVTVYCNEMEAAATTANSAGTWFANISLHDPEDYSAFDIYAAVTRGGYTYETAHTSVYYVSSSIDVKKISMYHTVRGEEQCTVFDYENPSSGGTYYLLDEEDFTFVIEFAGETDRLGNVRLNVFTADGEMYSYDAAENDNGVYVVAESGIVPVNVGVTYTCELSEDYAYSDITSKEYREIAYEQMASAAESAMDLIEAKAVEFGEDESTFHVVFGMADSEDESLYFDLIFTLLSYEDTVKTIETQNFAQAGENCYYLVVVNEETLEYIWVDTEEETAFSVSMPLELEEEDTAAFAAASYSVYTGPVKRSFATKLVFEVLEKSPTPVPFLSEGVAFLDYYKLREFLRAQRNEAQDQIFDLKMMLWDFKMARCPNGEPRIYPEQISECMDHIISVQTKEELLYQKMDNALNFYMTRIRNSALFSLASRGFGRLVKAGIAQLGKIPQSFTIYPWDDVSKLTSTQAKNLIKILNCVDKTENFVDKVKDYVGAVLDAVDDNLSGYALPDPNENGFWDFDDIYSTPYYNAIVNEYETLIYIDIEYARGHIRSSLNPCKDKPDPEEPKDKSPCPDKMPIIDPSGWVYEAVPSNRLSGVTAAVSTASGLWNAAEYDQVNPQITDADGYFQWDVPEGTYHVVFSKDGYEAAATDDLNVPPPQINLMIPMVSTAAPVVTQAVVYTDRAELIFSQYMDIDSVKAAASLLQGETAVTVDIVPLDAEFNADGTEQYATRFALVPETGVIDGNVSIAVTNAAKNYAQTAMAEDYRSEALAPQVRPTALSVSDAISIGLSQPTSITVTLQPGLAGQLLTVKNGSPSLFSVSYDTLVTDENGSVRLTLTGLLPGIAYLTVCEPISGLERTIQVQITDIVVEAVTAALPDGTIIESGATVPAGTAITLTTATAGAEIRYTLDDTCPKQASALTYSQPITVTESVVLRAVAVLNGVYSATIRLNVLVDSETAYTITFNANGGSCPTASLTTGTNGTLSWLPTASRRNYSFNGWYTAASGGTKVTTSTVFTEDTTVYAQWTYCGGSGASDSDETHGDTTPGGTTPAGTNPFLDISEGAYYYDAVLWSVENGITTGTALTAFSPDMSCTRAQMVTFLWRAAGSPEPATSVSPFTDVKRGEYYYDAVLWAVEKGVTTGTGAATFSPDMTVTRGQTVTLLYRYAGSPAVGGGSAFTDVAADAYYAEAVRWAVETGVTYGTSATTFSPESDCTRAQIVTLLYRYLTNE